MNRQLMLRPFPLLAIFLVVFSGLGIARARVLSAPTRQRQLRGDGAAYDVQQNRQQLVAPTALAPDELPFVETAKLTVGTPEVNFGRAIALDNNTVVVGATWEDIDGKINQGSAYVFVYDGTSWVQQARLTASDGEAEEYFGAAVALQGDTAFIGAPDVEDEELNRGAVYVFERQGTTWTQQAKLIANDAISSYEFGSSLALDGNMLLVGAGAAAIGTNAAQGAVYVFVKEGSSWIQQAKLTASDGARLDFFGGSIALYGDTALVGARGAQEGPNQDAGAAYVFVREGISWSEKVKLMPSDGQYRDSFGRAVALGADTAFISLGGYDRDNYNGGVYVFDREGANWTEQTTLTPSSDVADSWSHAQFGRSIALEGNTMLVGAPSADGIDTYTGGATFVFTRNENGWSQEDKLYANDVQDFGRETALDGDRALINAVEAVYVFERQLPAHYNNKVYARS